MMTSRIAIGTTLLALTLAASPSATAATCRDSVATRVPQPTAAQMNASGLGKLPVAPASRRVDLVARPFSDSTNVTNPLFPIKHLRSVVLNGRVDGKPFRTETTLLPETRVIEWSPGQCVRTLVSQYVAYLDGRVQEVALDFYAQADDGSVWYFGEDVYNYERGAVADTAGTWLAGKEGPAAMIMPARPRVGDVNRPENIPGLVWEEVSTKTVGRTVAGPRGPIGGALVGRELHDDGSFSDKIFAPGYGEFYSAHEGDVEALALAIPTDSRPVPEPAALKRLSGGAYVALTAAGSRRWESAGRELRRLNAAWRAHRAAVPGRLTGPVTRSLRALERAVKARNRARARNYALDLKQAVLDVELQYRPVAQVDRARIGLWSRQVLVDAAAGDLRAVSGDTAVMEWLRDRITTGLDPVVLTRLDTTLERLRSAVVDREPAAAAKAARALRKVFSRPR